MLNDSQSAAGIKMVDHNMASEVNQDGTNAENMEPVNGENVENLNSAEQEASAENVEQALKNKVAALEAELAEQKADFLRARADLENSRKRLEKDKQVFIKYGLEGILKDLLPCLDSFEQAVAQADEQDNVGKFKEGVILVKKQLHEVLVKHGLSQVEAHDAVFNPDLHQAIRKEEADGVEEEKVGEVYQHGYSLHDRLLRPAMVSVIMPKG